MGKSFFFEEKKNTGKKQAIALAIIILAVVAAAFLLGFKPLLPEAIQQKYSPSTAEKETAGIIRDYGIPQGVFEELPAVPADFNKIVSLMHKNIFTNYDFFSKDYYLQPEFYTSFRQNGLEYWQKPDATRYGVAGIGFFPANQEIMVAKGGEATASFFVHAAFGVRSFQGIRLKAVAPGNAGGLSVEILDAEFLLGPSFPKFSANWANRARVKITASSEAKSGIYDFIFEIAAPSAENSEKWRAQSQGNYFETAKAGAGVFETITVKVE